MDGVATNTVPNTGVWNGTAPSQVVTIQSTNRPTELRADVVVIGSGAGGAVAAAELALGGLDVVLLEEGGLFTTEDFQLGEAGTRALPALKSLYRDAGASAIMGRPPILFAEGRCVGGSTVINGGMSWRTPERVLAEWQREHGIHGVDPKSMELVFERVENRISARHQDEETIGNDTSLLAQGARKLGYEVYDNIRNQRHCAGSNNCAFGCPTGAKQSTLLTYVPDALTHGARLLANCRASRVLIEGERVSGVQAHYVDQLGNRYESVQVHAPVVVVACGAAHTPAILSRSGVKNRWVGRNLKVHPNAKVIGIFPEPIHGWEGVHQAHQVREFQEEGLVMAVANVPPGMVAMTLPHIGRKLGEYLDAYDRMLMAGCLVEDTGSGRVRVAPGGRPIMSYQLTPTDAYRLKRGVGLLAEMLFEAGAERVLLPFVELDEIRTPDDIRRIFADHVKVSHMEVLTVHIMGSARMGSGPERSVTDPFGHVWGIEGLVVADASLFPGPIGVNPMESIMALATRASWDILDRWTELSRGWSHG